MTPSQIRAELLGQHAGLRVLMQEAREAIARGSPRDDLRDCVQRLATALRAHNRREETLLREIIRKVDAWGPARAEIMDESHVDEHLELLAALLGTNGASDAASAGKGVAHVLERLEAHIAREEEVLLAEDVLRDDDVVIEYFGG
jgi:DUF438 domain-containing protein